MELATFMHTHLTWKKHLLALFTCKASNAEDGRGLCLYVSTSIFQDIGYHFD